MVELWIFSGWFYRFYRLIKVIVMIIIIYYMYSIRKDIKYKVGIMFLFLMFVENFVFNVCGMFE